MSGRGDYSDKNRTTICPERERERLDSVSASRLFAEIMRHDGARFAPLLWSKNLFMSSWPYFVGIGFYYLDFHSHVIEPHKSGDTVAWDPGSTWFHVTLHRLFRIDAYQFSMTSILQVHQTLVAPCWRMVMFTMWVYCWSLRKGIWWWYSMVAYRAQNLTG